MCNLLNFISRGRVAFNTAHFLCAAIVSEEARVVVSLSIQYPHNAAVARVPKLRLLLVLPVGQQLQQCRDPLLRLGQRGVHVQHLDHM
jgi:hypothetical protein